MLTLGRSSTTAVTKWLDALDQLTSDLDGGTCKIYTGTKPANGLASPTGTLLATFTFTTPAFVDDSVGVKRGDFVAIAGDGTQSTAIASGTPGWFRCSTVSSTTAFDGSFPDDATCPNLSVGEALKLNTFFVYGIGYTFP